jgi:hypothetical protein
MYTDERDYSTIHHKTKSYVLHVIHKIWSCRHVSHRERERERERERDYNTQRIASTLFYISFPFC